jgi:hypothetical protein
MNSRTTTASLFALLAISAGTAAAQAPDPLAVRKAINDACAAIKGAKEPVEKVENLTVAASGREIPVRLYRPRGVGPFLISP